jgi:proliferating cell nuclear antigen
MTTDGNIEASQQVAPKKRNSKKTTPAEPGEADREYITFEKATLEAALDAVKELVPEFRMHVMDHAVTVMAVDTANVAMVALTMGRDAFVEFHMQPREIGIDCARIKDGLKAMQDGNVDLIHQGGKYILTDGTRRFEYKPLDVNTIRKDPQAPTMALEGNITLNNAEFAKAIADVKPIGDKAVLTLQADLPDEMNNRLNIFVEGSEDKLDSPLEEILDAGQPPSPRGAWRSLFSLDYLTSIGKVIKGASGSPASLKVELGKDKPVRLTITLVPGVTVTYLLAPRIETD